LTVHFGLEGRSLQEQGNQSKSEGLHDVVDRWLS
jgi:hypothetical protein